MTNSKPGRFPTGRIVLSLSFLTGIVLIYLAMTTPEGAKTADGYGLASFFYVTASIFLGVPFLFVMLTVALGKKALKRAKPVRK